MEEFESSTINSRSSSSIQTEAVAEFSVFIERLSPIVSEMKDSIEITELPAFEKAMESLETDYKRARAAMDTQTVQSSPAKHIERLVQNLGRSLGLVLFASHEAPLSNKQKIEALCKEMMNVRFELSSDRESDFADEGETEEETGEETEEETEEIAEEKTEVMEIVEEETTVLTVDDALVQIKYGGVEEFKTSLLLLSGFMRDGMISDERVVDEDVVRILTSRLSSWKGNERLIIIQILRYLAQQNDEHKEKMKDLEFLSALVKSLARDVEEQKAAVGLLLSLSGDAGVRRRIGRIQGCILMLVAISNGDDEGASHDARWLLNLMSSNAQHALHMAEAGYFKPLIKYLKEGSEMNKVLMATALSRLELTDQNKTSLGRDGAIEPLVSMFKAGNLEAKLSALNALHSLSNLKENIQRLIESGMVAALLQLLFSVTSVLMTLREPASAILARVAESETILVKHDIAQQMLSLLNLSSPIIQNHLLEALNSIISHSTASRVRKKMKENGAIQLLLPLITDRDARIRQGALKLIFALSRDTLTEQLDHSHVLMIAHIASTTTASECEKAAALGILSNLPLSDRKITDIFKHTNLLPLLVSFSPATSSLWLAESIAGLLIRFTSPNDKKLQHYAVENGVIPLLLKLLTSSSETAKAKAAMSLAQLSQNSITLSKSKRLKWFCVPPSSDSFCEVHDGYCTAKTTFCLVKAGAITPLLQILQSAESGADEAVLSCLSTLLHDEIWESGCHHLVKKSCIHSIIKVLSCGSFKAQEKALWMLERIFRVEAHREEYGESAEVVLIDLAQNGDPMLAPAVAKVLAQLELMQAQSSYF